MSYQLNWIHRSALGCAIVFLWIGMAHATTYSPLSGPNVAYNNINENDNQIAGPPAVTSNPGPLFGQPVLSPAGSDNMAFPALTFSVAVANGQFMLQDGTLRFDIAPSTVSSTIHSVTFDEGGAWRVLGPDLAASAEATLVYNDFRITAVNGVALGVPIIVAPTFSVTSTTQIGSAHVTSSTGDITFASSGANAVGTWDITANFNIDAALAAHNLAGQRVTGMSVALDNELLGQTQNTEGLTLATIDKKHFIVSENVTTIPVPEGSTLVMALSGGLGLLLAHRRQMLKQTSIKTEG